MALFTSTEQKVATMNDHEAAVAVLLKDVAAAFSDARKDQDRLDYVQAELAAHTQALATAAVTGKASGSHGTGNVVGISTPGTSIPSHAAPRNPGT